MGRVSQRGSRFGRLVRLGLNQLVFLGLRPPPPQRYPLSEAQAALQSLDDGGVLGKVVLEPKRMLAIRRYGDAVTDRRANTRNSHPLPA